MPEHNHKNDGIFRGRGSSEPCKRCILEQSAPRLLEACKLAEDAICVVIRERPAFIRTRNIIRSAISEAERG